MSDAIIAQALGRAFDRLSETRARLSGLRESMDLADHADLWLLVAQARMAVSTARDELKTREAADGHDGA